MSMTRATLYTITLLAALTARAYGQDLPVATGPSTNQGFSMPDPLTGGFRFGVTGSESIRFGYYGVANDVYLTTLSGDAAYLSGSTTKPVTLVYSGGYLYSRGQPDKSSIPASSSFQNLAYSQSLLTREWSFDVSNSFRYLPEAPTSGLSGLSGLGDIGITQPVVGNTGQDILTLFGQRVINTTEGSVGRNLTASTSVKGSGSYTFQRFLDNSGGLDNNGFTGSGTLEHRISALKSVGSTYQFSRFTYPIDNFSFDSQSIQLHYTQSVSRTLQYGLGGGPLRISSNVPTLVPTSWNFGAIAELNYVGRRYDASLHFDRSARSGSGVVQGTVADNLNALLTHRLSRSATISGAASYTHDSSVGVASNRFSIQSVLANVQGTQALSRDFSAFISYSVQKQVVNGTVVTNNSFSGLNQVLGFGVTYSPAMVHLSHK